MIEDIWPFVEKANQESPNFAKVAKPLILIASPKKKFARAGKGTVQRRTTLKLFEEEIDALYKDADKLEAPDSSGMDRRHTKSELSSDPTALANFVHEAVLEVTAWSEVEDTANLFLLGMDSLQALLLTRRLRSALNLPHLAPSIIYSNQSINVLSKALISTLNAETASHASDVENWLSSVDQTLDLHKASIDRIVNSLHQNESVANNIHETSKVSESSEKVFILTGSTGSIGSYLLSSLLRTPGTSHIYCLNRGKDSAALQRSRNQSRHLTYELVSAKVSFLSASLTQTHLGIPFTTYSELQGRVTHIIHNAWPVDFNLSLDSFEPSLAGLNNLVKLAATCSRRPRLLFLSSISATINLPQDIVPEKVAASSTAPQASGYAASKYIAEEVLNYASAKLELPISIARIGQVAGPVHTAGAWNPNEWFPGLLISSATIGAIPDSLGQLPIDWVPVDVLADVLQEIALVSPKSSTEKSHTATVFQPVNSAAVSWSSLLPSAIKAHEAHTQKPMQVVSLREWIEKVRAEAEMTRGSDKKTEAEVEDIAQMLRRSPAAKLLDWFRGLLALNGEGRAKKWNNERAAGASQTLRDLGPVSPEWMGMWVEHCFK